MNRQPWLALLALGAAGAALWASGPAALRAQEAETRPRDPPPRPESRLVPQRQWEYSQLPCLPTGDPNAQRREIEDRLNEQGKRGWELVGLLEVDRPPGRGCLLATFKRQVLN
jgi:hypothetical protein